MDCYELFPSGLRVEHLPAWCGSFKFHSLTRVILGCSYGGPTVSAFRVFATIQLGWGSFRGLRTVAPCAPPRDFAGCLLFFVALLVEECCPYEIPVPCLGLLARRTSCCPFESFAARRAAWTVLEVPSVACCTLASLKEWQHGFLASVYFVAGPPCVLKLWLKTPLTEGVVAG